MRQLAAAVMLVVGMALIVVGVGSATWWKDSPIIEASTETTSESGVIATNPGVLELVDDTVRVTARAPGTTVEMVVASTDIANLWLGDEPHASVTGLSTWSSLSTAEPDEDTAPEEPLTLEGSDLFHPENFISAEGSVELHFVVPPGDWTLIALGQDGTTPQLTLTWEREVTTPLAIPLSIVGIVLLAAGSALFIYHSQRTAAEKRREESLERGVRRREADATETSVLPALKSLRRDRRGRGKKADDQPEVRGEVRDETGGSFGAGILPASPRAEEFRSAGAEDEADKTAADDVTADEETIDADEAQAEAAEGSDEVVESADEADAGHENTETGDISSASHESPVDMDEGAQPESADPADETSGESRDDESDGRQATSAEWRSLWGFGVRSDEDEK